MTLPMLPVTTANSATNNITSKSNQTPYGALSFGNNDLNHVDQTLLFSGTACIDFNKSLNQLQYQEMKAITDDALSFSVPSTPFSGAISAGDDSMSSFISLFSATTTIAGNQSIQSCGTNAANDNANAYYTADVRIQQLPISQDQLALLEPFVDDGSFESLFQFYNIDAECLSLTTSTSPSLGIPASAPTGEDHLFTSCSSNMNDVHSYSSFFSDYHENFHALSPMYDDLEYLATMDISSAEHERDPVHPSDTSSMSATSHTYAIPLKVVDSPLSSPTNPSVNDNSNCTKKPTATATVSFQNACFTSVFDANTVNHLYNKPSITKYKRRKSSLYFNHHHTLLASRRRSSFSAYTCNFCSRTFSRKYDVVRHKRIHTGAKPYVCPCCSKRFARSDARVRHFRTEPKCQDGLKTMKKQKKKQQQQQFLRRKSSLKKLM